MTTSNTNAYDYYDYSALQQTSNLFNVVYGYVQKVGSTTNTPITQNVQDPQYQIFEYHTKTIREALSIATTTDNY